MKKEAFCVENLKSIYLSRKKEVALLKVQNDRLINNLREMSIKLDETLEKVKLRNYEKPSVNSESSRGKLGES